MTKFRLTVAIVYLITLLMAAACSDDSGALLEPTAASESTIQSDVQEEVPPREEDFGAIWLEMSTSELWSYLASRDSIVNVGIKDPGAARGIWRNEVLVSDASWAAGVRAVAAVPGIDVLHADSTWPMMQVRVHGRGPLTMLRNVAFTDYVEPNSLEGGFLSGCGWETWEWNDPPTYTFAGDYMAPHYTRSDTEVQIAWKRSDGAGVTIGLTDTGLSSAQNHLTTRFSEAHSSGRWRHYTTTIGGDWWGDCSHGTRMAGALAAPMNGANMAGVAWRSNLVSVRLSDDVTDRVNASAAANGIDIAATGTPPGQQPGNRIVVMAWYATSSNTIGDRIRAHEANNVLFIGAAGSWRLTTSWVVFPARMEEVIAVSGVNADYSRVWRLAYGPEVELAFPITQLTLGEWTTHSRAIHGSSGSAAIVAGIAALAWSQFPSLTNRQIRQRLRWAGHAYPNRTETVGYGVPNAVKAVGGLHGARVDAPQWADPYSSFTATAEPLGGNGPFTYLWSNGSTTKSTTFGTGSEGTQVSYSVQVTDSYDGITRQGGGTTYVQDRSECEEWEIDC